jgi:UDP-N-acetylmuramoyl-tripeptide--D-alanyl-D-alanine ligase
MVAVLGDMRELGSYEQEGHQSVGIRAAGVADLLVTVGELGHTIGEAALEAGMDPETVFMFDDAAGAIAQLRALIQPGDLILVKGSRAVGMDDVVQNIHEENPKKKGS